MLYKLSANSFNKDDLAWLREVEKILGNGTTAEDMLMSAAEGYMQIWRARQGVVVTRVLAAPGGRTLEVVGIAGKGMAVRAQELFSDLRKAATAYGCRWVSGTILDERFAKKCRKYLPFAGYKFIEEIKHG